jgi:hypothetical protein
VVQWVRVFLFNQEIAGSNPGGARLFLFILFSFFSFFYIQMFFYTIMKIFIALLENINKSRASAGRLSLTLSPPAVKTQ